MNGNKDERYFCKYLFYIKLRYFIRVQMKYIELYCRQIFTTYFCVSCMKSYTHFHSDRFNIVKLNYKANACQITRKRKLLYIVVNFSTFTAFETTKLSDRARLSQPNK